MKCVRLLGVYCEFPEGVSDINSFADYMNEHFHSYVKLTSFSEANCVPPYFIEEEKETAYINASTIGGFVEKEIVVLPREEYEKRLRKVVAQKCVHCKHYTENLLGDNLQGHRDEISLDGECASFEEIDFVEPKYQS